MALIATVGGASSNSYVTMDEADTYFSTRLSMEQWIEYTESLQESALLEAAERLDQEEYLGQIVSHEQAMKFPRYGIIDEESRVVISTTIPQRVKNAQCELALALLISPETFTDGGLEQFSSVSVGQGDLALTIRGGATTAKMPSQVSRLLQPFWAGGQAAIIRS